MVECAIGIDLTFVKNAKYAYQVGKNNWFYYTSKQSAHTNYRHFPLMLETVHMSATIYVAGKIFTITSLMGGFVFLK
jgi:hypothetical protein